jgi:hypothetical protein
MLGGPYGIDASARTDCLEGGALAKLIVDI